MSAGRIGLPLAVVAPGASTLTSGIPTPFEFVTRPLMVIVVGVDRTKSAVLFALRLLKVYDEGVKSV